jgi:hypothetical protein
MALDASRAILTGMCAVIVHVRVELTTTLVEIDSAGSEREELPSKDGQGQREKR